MMRPRGPSPLLAGLPALIAVGLLVAALIGAVVQTDDTDTDATVESR